MKKIYTLAILLFAGITTSYSQTHKEAMAKDFATDVVKSEKVINQKTPGYQVWGDDFSTPSNWVLDNATSTGPTFGWTIDAVNNSWYFNTAITSTSGGNYLELSNGSASAGTQATGVVYTCTTTDSIDLVTSGTNVSLSFQQYGARFNDLQEIQISTNGTSFVPVGNNLNYAVLSQSGGSAYPNGGVKSINLAPYLSGATKVWVRFSWTTNFPSSTSANAWITYGWYIDDVSISTNADNDVKLVNSYYSAAGVKYSKIPVSQIAPINMVAVVNNNGINPLKNLKLDATVNPGATLVSSTPLANLTGAQGDTALISADYTPTGLGSYTITSLIVHDSIEDVPTNNAVGNSAFDVVPFIYALDNGVANGTTSDSDPATVFEVGNVFDIITPVDCWGVFARIGTGTPATGTINVQVNLRVYDATLDDYVLVNTSSSVLVTASLVNIEKFYKFDFPITLEAGKTYLATISSYDEGLRITNAGTSLIGTSLIQYSDDLTTWFYQNNTPWVRLSFDPSLGLEEKNGGLTLSNVYPNPTTGNSTVSFSLENAQDVNVTVYNVAGQTVYSNDMGTVQAGAHSIEINSKEFNAGVYMVNITSNDGVVTKKLIKK